MIKNVYCEDDAGWINALESIPSKSYRRTKNGRFEAYCSDHTNYIYLGTYETAEEAELASLNYRIERLVSRVDEYGLDINDGVVFMSNYIAFPNGLIFNLHGEIMRGGVNRDGYHYGIFNGKSIQTHRIIASIFCEREIGKDYVNHIDGNKLNNSCENLEWVTRSENTLHSYRTGLQTRVGGSRVYTTDELRYIQEHCYDSSSDVADYLGRNKETVRKYMYKYRNKGGQK